MWYRFKKANIGGGAIKSTPLLPVSSQDNQKESQELKDTPDYKNYDETNQELLLLLEQMGQTLEDYYEMSRDQQKELWDILVYRPHHIGGNETLSDVDTSIFGDQLASEMNRMKSPYHDIDESMEEKLEGSRHRNNNVEPLNKQSQEAGNGILLQTGLSNSSFFQQGQSGAAFKGDLPSARTLI